MIFENEVKHSTELRTSLGTLVHSILYNKCGTKYQSNIVTIGQLVPQYIIMDPSWCQHLRSVKTTGIYDLENVTIFSIFLQIFDYSQHCSV